MPVPVPRSSVAERSVVALVRERAAAAPRRAALIVPDGRGGREVGYAELVARADAVAAGLAARSVVRGDRVVVFVPLGVDLYTVLIATMSVGAVAVFIEPGASAVEIDRVVRATRPQAFVGVARAHALRVMSRAVANVPVKVIVGRADVRWAVPLAELERTPAVPLPAAGADWPALLTFSSGTGGTPKGAVRTHRFLLAQHRAIEPFAFREPGDPGVDLTSFPIVVLSSLASGATVVLPERWGRRGVARQLDVIDRYAVTTLAASPALVEPLLALAATRERRLASVRRVLVGGAPVSLRLCELAASGVLPNGVMTVVYGSTEAEPIASIGAEEIRLDAADAIRAGAGLCVGRVHAEVAVALIRPTDAPLRVERSIEELAVAVGAAGEIAVAGPHVNERYYRAPEAERQTKLREGDGRIWHRTGDLGRFDAAGRLWLAGRVADRVMAADGRVLDPGAAEAAVQATAGAGRAALVVDRSGALVLVVAPRSPRELVGWLRSPRARERARARLAAAAARAGAAGVRVHLAPALPLDIRHRAKIDYRAVRRVYARRWARWLP